MIMEKESLKEYIAKRYSKTLVNGYLSMIKRFELIMGEKAETATYNDILNYIGMLRESKNSRNGKSPHPKTLRNNLFTLKIYFRYLISIGKRNDHPCQELYLKDQINKQIQVESLYSKEVLEELFENWKSKEEINQRRDKIIVSLLVFQALLVSEISELKTSDLDLENGTINIKGNLRVKSRILVLKPKQIMLFYSYLEKDYMRYQKQQPPSKRQDYFILNPEGLKFREGLINILINRDKDKQTKLIPLKIRQSVIANLLKSENDLRIVQEFAGHRRTASTEAYKQTGLEELKLSIEKLHPLQ
jgi:site-specific recombinase XerD